MEPDLIKRSDLKTFEVLGEGGFGVVYKGRWKGAKCAIKEVNIANAQSIDKEDLKKEARLQR